MSQRPDNVQELSDTLTMCEFHAGGAKGFWLWDETRGMNLSMRAATAEDALVEAITYYQKRLTEVEAEHSDPVRKVNSFLSQFSEEYDVD